MHLYLHVPFCARRCSYCDFAIAVRRETPDAAYVEGITGEWRRRLEHPAWSDRRPLRTVYFGGGTPSRLDPASVATLLATFRDDRGIEPDAEITLEANPDDVTAERAEGWVAAGVTRVSLGVQSHDPAVLAWMHRTHRAEQVAPAVRALRDAGLHDLSLDLIFALPPVLERDWALDLETTFALEPTHVSLYGLTVEPHTPLGRWTERGEVSTTPDERYAEEYLAAHDALVGHGFEHYEVSNAGRPGFRARHNSAYWTGAEYLGLGPSAHSLLGEVRSWNRREWAAWSRDVTAGNDPTEGEERLGGDARRLEGWYLGLRTTGGLPVDRVPAASAARWTAAGWAVTEHGRLRLTADGWLRLDALVAAIAAS